MRNSILAKSLQQSLDRGKPRGSEPENAPSPSPGSTPTAPSSLRTMSDILSSAAEQAPIEVDVSEIAESEVADRFDIQEGLADLVSSIGASGQRLPVLLRHRRGEGPRYEVVYGRRRIAACRALGRRVIAHVREMSLDDALMSQALENSARLERSFIEQAVFASKLEGAGFSGERVCEALAIDNTTLSRLRSVVRVVPADIVFRIGAAPGIGRRPWMELRDLLAKASPETLGEIGARIPEAGAPGERLESLIKWLSVPGNQRPTGERRTGRKRIREAETLIGSISFHSGAGNLVLKAAKRQDRAFLAYLESRLETLYADWARNARSDEVSD